MTEYVYGWRRMWLCQGRSWTVRGMWTDWPGPALQAECLRDRPDDTERRMKREYLRHLADGAAAVHGGQAD